MLPFDLFLPEKANQSTCAFCFSITNNLIKPVFNDNLVDSIYNVYKFKCDNKKIKYPDINTDKLRDKINTLLSQLNITTISQITAEYSKDIFKQKLEEINKLKINNDFFTNLDCDNFENLIAKINKLFELYNNNYKGNDNIENKFKENLNKFIDELLTKHKDIFKKKIININFFKNLHDNIDNIDNIGSIIDKFTIYFNKEILRNIQLLQVKNYNKGLCDAIKELIEYDYNNLFNINKIKNKLTTDINEKYQNFKQIHNDLYPILALLYTRLHYEEVRSGKIVAIIEPVSDEEYSNDITSLMQDKRLSTLDSNNYTAIIKLLEQINNKINVMKGILTDNNGLQETINRILDVNSKDYIINFYDNSVKIVNLIERFFRETDISKMLKLYDELIALFDSITKIPNSLSTNTFELTEQEKTNFKLLLNPTTKTLPTPVLLPRPIPLPIYQQMPTELNIYGIKANYMYPEHNTNYFIYQYNNGTQFRVDKNLRFIQINGFNGGRADNNNIYLFENINIHLLKYYLDIYLLILISNKKDVNTSKKIIGTITATNKTQQDKKEALLKISKWCKIDKKYKLNDVIKAYLLTNFLLLNNKKLVNEFLKIIKKPLT